jgi:hypothetical protein
MQNQKAFSHTRQRYNLIANYQFLTFNNFIKLMVMSKYSFLRENEYALHANKDNTQSINNKICVFRKIGEDVFRRLIASTRAQAESMHLRQGDMSPATASKGQCEKNIAEGTEKK